MSKIKGTFDLFGMGDGDELFADFEPSSQNVTSFAKAADHAARTGEYWKPEAPTIDAAALENFRDMVLGLDHNGPK